MKKRQGEETTSDTKGGRGDLEGQRHTRTYEVVVPGGADCPAPTRGVERRRGPSRRAPRASCCRTRVAARWTMASEGTGHHAERGPRRPPTESPPKPARQIRVGTRDHARERQAGLGLIDRCHRWRRYARVRIVREAPGAERAQRGRPPAGGFGRRERRRRRRNPGHDAGAPAPRRWRRYAGAGTITFEAPSVPDLRPAGARGAPRTEIT